MTNTTSSSTTTANTASNPFQSFLDPANFIAASQQNMAKLVEQYAVLEAQLVARAQQAVMNMAQLAQDAIAYSTQLSTEARKLAFSKWT